MFVRHSDTLPLAYRNPQSTQVISTSLGVPRDANWNSYGCERYDIKRYRQNRRADFQIEEHKKMVALTINVRVKPYP